MRRVFCTLIVVLTLGSTAGSSVRAGDPSADFQPDPKSVQRYGPAYRYPQAGWTVLHIEGAPYERGYQHGKLMPAEIAGHLRCLAAMQNSKAPAEGWKQVRTLVNALFLRRYEKEYLEEMKGIAEGATAGGAKIFGKPVDLVDIVALNSWPEIETLPSALDATETGLESIRFPKHEARAATPPKPMHCSAFAATGPATADGKIVFGHITMFSLYASSYYNVWLDVKPDKGHRVFMQSYPGGMQSGMDYYYNDAGLLVSETTIAQTKFDIKGMTVASRIRQTLQYADSIDKAVEILGKDNNGLYTNEWLLADIKTDEIAMYELGTAKSKLYRSSKGEWFGGTEGFYWGCNNTKDIAVRLETVASLDGKPANPCFCPAARDKVWVQLYDKHKGKIGVEFGKEAFTTPIIAASHSLDAKFTTTDMAKQLKTWALFGPPLGRSWQPTPDERQRYPEIQALASNPWTILTPQAPAKTNGEIAKAVDLDELKEHEDKKAKSDDDEDDDETETGPAWHGTIVPKTDADIWLAAGFADYERYYSLEMRLKKASHGKLTEGDRDRLAVERYGYLSSYRVAVKTWRDVPLAETKASVRDDAWYRIAAGKGFWVLHDLRQCLGDEAFVALMNSFGKDNAGKATSTDQFRAHVEKQSNGKFTGKALDAWTTGKGLRNQSDGAFTIQSFHSELDQTLIVYGTVDEVAANKEAAETLQKAIITHGSNLTVGIKTDKEVTDEDLKTHHLVLIGRPDSNLLVEKCRAKPPIQFGPRSFVVRGESYANAGSAVIVAAENPVNPRFSMVVIAGLGADATLRAAPRLLSNGSAQVLVLPKTGLSKALALPAPDLIADMPEAAPARK
jgi:hypothetical protein